ncbi:GlsB/YeaQ/YmgE family stress response membrane protein [Catenuloplanes sp. NPDC051500]|uniref:GlsB/YeaQ/YmgE family stress response membrane protein n=1 Tax=Catenuloplanes sp. NPDC051500 TaxID=3363959 RepID=UPI0037B03319
MGIEDYVSAIVFGAVIGVVARILLPGRQSIGVILTVLIGVAAAVGGTWVSDRYGLHSDYTFTLFDRGFDWLVVGVQVGIAVVGVAIAALLARGFSTDRDDD